MDPERWQKIDKIFQSVLEHAPDERSAFLDEACRGDSDLQKEVEAMMAAYEQARSFLDAPAFAMADHASRDNPADRVDLYCNTLLKERYLLVKIIGRGGFGVVYLALDQQLLSKPVVVKILLEDSAKDEWIKKKFRHEIEALARIDHPGIVAVLDAGETPDGKPYFVMQFVKGVSLRSVMRPNGMELGRVANIIKQIGQALTAAHDAGIYHRDLKPENIMLQELGESEQLAKIIDFGIARVEDSKLGISTTSKIPALYLIWLLNS